MKSLVRSLYHFIPFKKEVYTLLKKIWVPKHTIYKHLSFKGIFTVKIDSAHKFKIKNYGFELENEIFWSGLTDGWEKVSVNLWITLCKQSSVVFDIGANTGIYALITKSLNPNAKVFAFEPVERVYEKLVHNAAINKFDIISLPYAVSDSNGKGIIYDMKSEHIYSVTVNKNLNATDVEVIEKEIETRTLDSVIEEYKLPALDLLKIDVETHEPEVLAGFREGIRRFKPTILIEVLNDEVGEKIENEIRELNYLYYNIDELKGITKVPHITKSDYYNYLLCSPETAKGLGLPF